MNFRLFKKAVFKSSEKGLTATELLIAMTIFLIVMGSVYGILKIGNMSRSNINSRTENIKNVRMAIDTIGREAVNAGLGYNRVGGSVPDNFTTYNFGLPADPDTETDLLTAISAGTRINTDYLAKNGEKTDVVAFAFRDFQFNDGFPITINNVSNNGTSLVLKTPDGACVNCRPYDLFLIETGDGKRAIILSTDIVNNDSIVLGGSNDPLSVNYGSATTNSSGSNSGSGSSNSGPGSTSSGSGSSGGGIGICLPGDLLCISLNGGTSSGSGSGSSGSGSGTSGSTTSGSTNTSIVKQCVSGVTQNCINYGSTTVVAKKIYLVSYSVMPDGTLIRTTYGNNTGETADKQIVRQPIAKGVKSFKLSYLLSDGTVTDDPSVANTEKERCNEIVQIEVIMVVESEINQDGVITSEPITLTSTFSTRNLKYDVY